jgi:hypothetical protein
MALSVFLAATLLRAPAPINVADWSAEMPHLVLLHERPASR